MQRLIFAALISLSFQVKADTVPPSNCTAQIPFGQPAIQKPNSTILCRKAYILEHDNVAKIPEWVSYVLTPDHALGCVKRSNAFEPDYDLPADKRSTPKDYAKSGYDIGHQANDGDMAWDVQVERQSFLLSNMAPQLPGFNRGIWKRLEDQVRAWTVNFQQPLLVYAGPIYNSSDRTIGADAIVVPHAFYKIVVNTVTKDVLVFEFKHEASTANLNSFIVPMSKVQADTGINFPLPTNSNFSNRLWPTTSKSVRRAKSGACH